MYVRFCQRYKIWLLVAALSSVVGCIALGQRVKVNPRIESLLPQDTDSARALAELRERLQSSTPLYLLAQSDDLASSRRVARELHRRVSEWPETSWAMYKRDASVFSDNRLLYLSASDIEELDEQIDERERWESCARLPGCTNLDDEAPPLPTDADLQALFDKDPNVRSMVSLFGKDSQAFIEAEPTSKSGRDADLPAADTTGGANEVASDVAELGELCDAQTRVCSVQVQIEGDADDLEFATRILERSEALFEQVRAELGVEAEMAVSGQFRNLPHTKRAVNRDLMRITLLSVALVLLVMTFQFRGMRPLLALLGPTLLGVSWTVGCLGAVHPEVNLISAFTLAVLAGLGIDFGVHMLTHYAERREHEEDAVSAVRDTLAQLLPSLAVAAFTTASAFAALGVTSFQGFAEMGPIAAVGIVLSLLAFLLVFPPLVLLTDGRAISKYRLRRYSFSSKPWSRRGAVSVAGAGLLVAIGMGSIGTQVSFEYDFRNLRPTGLAHGIPWSSTLHGTSRTSVYMLADDAAALRGAAEGIREERPKDIVVGDDSFIIIPAAFIPEQQQERLAALEGLTETLERAKRNASDELREKIDRFLPLARVERAITLERMPRWVHDWLVEKDGAFGTLAIIYVDLRGSDAKDMELLVDHMERWNQQHPEVRFASGEAQLGEVTPRLRQEAPTMLGLALLGVCFGTLIVGRSLKRLLWVLVPLGVMMAVSLGAMALLDLRTNLYNMLVFPLAFGIGVDGAVYVSWALSSSAPNERLPVAARAVLGSTLTSMAGFGSLTISSNPGLASIGWLALLMLSVALVANLVWLPAVHAALLPRQKKHP